MTRALAGADATFVVPFDYLRLPLVAAIALVVFGEVPDGWTLLGGAVIALSGIYIARREAKVRAVLPVAPHLRCDRMVYQRPARSSCCSLRDCRTHAPGYF